MKRWWITKDGQPDGPYSRDEITARIAEGRLSPSMLACPEGESAWLEIAGIAELSPQPPVPPPPPPTTPVHTRGPSGTVNVAAILTLLTALFWGGLALLQSIAFLANDDSGTAATAMWNVVIAAIQAWIVSALWQRNRRGYSWGLGTHALNAGFGLIQVFTGAPLLILVVPLHAIAAVLLWTSRAEFPAASTNEQSQPRGAE